MRAWVLVAAIIAFKVGPVPVLCGRHNATHSDHELQPVHAVTTVTTSSRDIASQAFILESARLRASRVGSSYGGWTFDAALLNQHSVVYSIGLGTDISWDLMMVKTTQCHVHGFDDTPVSTTYLRRMKLPEKFHWHRYLLSDRDEPLTLQLPRGHGVSYAAADVGSAFGFQKSSKHTARGMTITSMMAMLNHSHIDLLKIDVEGFEFRIFSGILLDTTSRDRMPAVLRLPACQLLLEFHSRLSPLGYQAKAYALLALQSLGFTLIHNRVVPHGADDAFLMNPRFCMHAHTPIPTTQLAARVRHVASSDDFGNARSAS